MEKLLRDELISYEYFKEPKKSETKTVMEELDIIEEKIEDGKGKDYYNFNNICDKLVEYQKIEYSIGEELKEIYVDIRIPVQHGIYARYIKKHCGNTTIPVAVIKIPTEGTPEQLIECISNGTKQPMNDKLSLHNPIVRQFVMPELFMKKSMELLFIIEKLVKIIKKIN